MPQIQPNELQEILRLLKQAGLDPMLCDCPVSFIDTAVCAGIPTEPGEHTRGEYILLPTELVVMHPIFVIPVKGQSMKDANLMDGDQLKVEVRDDVTDGDIVLASIDGECTVKNYFVDEDGDHWLVPRNDAYRPIRLTEDMNVRFIGRVTDIIRAVARTSYSHMAACVRKEKEMYEMKTPNDERVERTIVAIADKVEHRRQWFAVYKGLVAKKVFHDGDYEEFALLVHRLVPAHKRPADARELRRMEELSFRKSPYLWDKNNAPVTGKRFDDYLQIAIQVMEELEKM